MHVTQRAIAKVFAGSETTLAAVVAEGEGDLVRFLPGDAEVDRIGRAAAALCNYWGGVILVGIASDGRLDQPDVDRGQRAVARVREGLSPPIELLTRLVAFDLGSVLVVLVPEAASATTFDGEYFARILQRRGEAGPREMPLPTLQPGSSPEEKGRLLVIYTEYQLKLNSLDLSGTVVPPGAKLAGARWGGARLNGAILSGVDLHRSQIQGSALRGAQMVGVMLAEADIEGADMSGADLQGACLSSARLHRANLEGATLVGADLRGALMLGASLRGANIDGALLKGAEVDESTEWLAAWTPPLFTDAVARGVRAVNLQAFPAFIRGDMFPDDQPRTRSTADGVRLQIAPGLEIERPLADGATATVYVAVVTKNQSYAASGERVVVKLFRSVPKSKKSLERFRREIEVGVGVRSPHLVRYFDHGVYRSELEERPFIVMEHLVGTELTEAIHQTAGLSPMMRDQAVFSMLNDCLLALRTLNESGLVHRDLQPRNILVCKGRAVLLDFGLSRPAKSGATVTSPWEEIGTRRYLAPECIELDGDGWDEKSDIFMLGSCFLHAITGQFLFNDCRNYPLFYEALRSFGRGKPNVAPELSKCQSDEWPRSKRALSLMLAPDRAERPSAASLLRALRALPLRVASTRLSATYPLSRLFWSLAGRVRTSGQGPSPTVQALRRLASLRRDLREGAALAAPELGTPDNIEWLRAWGLLRQSDPKEKYYWETYYDGLQLEPGVAFYPTSACVAVDAALSDEATGFQSFVDAARKLSGVVRHSHRGDVDQISIGPQVFVSDRCYCGGQWWESLYSLAVRRYRLPTLRLAGVEFRVQKVRWA